MTAPDYADRIAAQLFMAMYDYPKNKEQMLALLAKAARSGYELRDGVGK